MTKRVAAIDCGTNSIRLLIADIQSERESGDSGPDQPSPLADVTRQMRIVRLGEGVDRTGRLSSAALDRTMAALSEYAELIAAAGPAAVRMVATSATRDAANSQEFTDRVKCLHALAAHELAVPGANPFGREALGAAGPWWSRGPCVPVPDAAEEAE